MSEYFEECRDDHMVRLYKIRDWDIANMAMKLRFDNWHLLHHSLKADKWLAIAALSAPDGYLPIEVTGKGDSPLMEFRSFGLMDDRDVVLAAVKRDCDAFTLASSDIRLDDTFMEEAVTANPRVINYVRAANPRYPDLVLAAVKRDPSCLRFASEGLRADRSIVLAAVRKYGGTLQHASEELTNDVEVVMTAIRAPDAFDMLDVVGDELASDKYVQKMADRANRLFRCKAWFRVWYWDFKSLKSERCAKMKNEVDNWLRRHGLEDWMDSKAKLMCYRPAKRARVGDAA